MKIVMEIDGDCLFCVDYIEDINHLFKDYLSSKEVQYNLIDVVLLLSIPLCILLTELSG